MCVPCHSLQSPSSRRFSVPPLSIDHLAPPPSLPPINGPLLPLFPQQLLPLLLRPRHRVDGVVLPGPEHDAGDADGGSLLQPERELQARPGAADQAEGYGGGGGGEEEVEVAEDVGREEPAVAVQSLRGRDVRPDLARGVPPGREELVRRRRRGGE